MQNRALRQTAVSGQQVATPIVKWAGGKSQLLNQLLPKAPARWNRYYEPFAGGAALFFALQPTTAVLCDTNAELTNTYAVTRDDVNGLIRALRHYRYDRDRFYEVRAQNPATMDEVSRAARFLYLNRTCFNGLYRVNRRGEFNVPFGRYNNPTICDAPKLRRASAALRGAEIRLADFENVADDAKRGDFVYFDPPYVPLNRTSSFTAYTAQAFGEEAQARLAGIFAKLDKKGCKVMLSNSDAPLVHQLYKGYRIDRVAATRNINSRATARGPIYEVIVRNY
jgi:DNA adenine methylase